MKKQITPTGHEISLIEQDFNVSKTDGYFSVRRQPSQEAINASETIYSEMQKVEQQTDTQEASDASLNWLIQVLDNQQPSMSNSC